MRWCLCLKSCPFIFILEFNRQTFHLCSHLHPGSGLMHCVLHCNAIFFPLALILCESNGGMRKRTDHESILNMERHEGSNFFGESEVKERGVVVVRWVWAVREVKRSLQPERHLHYSCVNSTSRTLSVRSIWPPPARCLHHWSNGHFNVLHCLPSATFSTYAYRTEKEETRQMSCV